jgi:hypothetical protein
MTRGDAYLLVLVLVTWLTAPVSIHAQCLGDLNGDQKVTIDELITVSGNAVNGCPHSPRFLDNRDGTITDTATGLMWERKQNLDGNPNLLDAHDADNQYSWSETGGAPDGTVYTVFLSGLNDCVSADGTKVTGGFAGYCNWRLPTIAELRTLVDLGDGACIGQPGGCLFSDLGSVGITSFIWSSTTCQDSSEYAWDLSPYDGSVGADAKEYLNFARAVREAR